VPSDPRVEKQPRRPAAAAGAPRRAPGRRPRRRRRPARTVRGRASRRPRARARAARRPRAPRRPSPTAPAAIDGGSCACRGGPARGRRRRPRRRVGEHRDLHAVADREGQALEQAAPGRDLPGQRLDEPGQLRGLLAPLFARPELALVKGAFRRPSDDGTGSPRAGEGGRVTELLARPLLDLHRPALHEVASQSAERASRGAPRCARGRRACARSGRGRARAHARRPRPSSAACGSSPPTWRYVRAVTAIEAPLKCGCGAPGSSRRRVALDRRPPRFRVAQVLVAVDLHLVAAAADGAHELRVARRPDAHDEERRPVRVAVQRAEHGGRPHRVGPVVKGQLDMARGREKPRAVTVPEPPVSQARGGGSPSIPANRDGGDHHAVLRGCA
jgi:hypothetical protein